MVMNNGMNACSAEKVYNDQIIAAVEKGLSIRFPSNLKAHLEAAQEFDFVETDRNIMKKQILAIDEEIEMGDGIDLELVRKRDRIAAELEEKERFWEARERDYPEREKAIAALRTRKFRTADHLKALVQRITVKDPQNYSILWFDGTTTDVRIKKGRIA